MRQLELLFPVGIVIMIIHLARNSLLALFCQPNSVDSHRLTKDLASAKVSEAVASLIRFPCYETNKL